MRKGNTNCYVLLGTLIAAILQLGFPLESATAEARSQTAPIIAGYAIPSSTTIAAASSIRQARVSMASKQKSLNAAIGELFQLIFVSSEAHWIRVDAASLRDLNETGAEYGRSPPNCVNALQ
jgi:hypothetical protein